MKRKTIDIDENTENCIKDMANKRNWSFSYMSYVLLKQAVREKNRKNKYVKENNPEHNSTDIR
jgi:hypothetical protein